MMYQSFHGSLRLTPGGWIMPRDTEYCMHPYTNYVGCQVVSWDSLRHEWRNGVFTVRLLLTRDAYIICFDTLAYEMPCWNQMKWNYTVNSTITEIKLHICLSISLMLYALYLYVHTTSRPIVKVWHCNGMASTPHISCILSKVNKSWQLVDCCGFLCLYYI